MPHKDPEARKAYNRAYRAAHPNLRKEEYQRNREHKLAKNRELYAQNGEIYKATLRQKRRDNPEKWREYDRQRLLRDGDRIRANARARYAKDPTPKRQRGRRYLQEHPERKRVYNLLYRTQHAEDLRAYRRQWRHANPATIQAYQARRRAAKRQAPRNDLTPVQWAEIKAAYDHRCVYCGKKFQRLTMDHIVPLSKGGEHTVSNVVPACRRCNSRKSAGAPLVPVQPLLLTVAPPRKKSRKAS